MKVQLAFKAYDVHELGCHFVARHAGLYERYQLEPRLLDATFTADDALPMDIFRVACGAALAGWLKGADSRVVFVAADRPMFWLYSQPGFRMLAELRGCPVAGYPPGAPPDAFLGEIWSAAGLALDELSVTPARDDVARLGLLRDGSAAAALISSAVPPAVLAGLGFEPLVFMGDELRVATTGLAVAPAFCAEQPELIAAMCACYRDAMALIHADRVLLEAALRGAAVGVGGDAASLAGPLAACYTRDGRSPAPLLAAGADGLARAMGIRAPRSVSELYDFSFLGAPSPH
jgi:ABC-type nitrate/sulfonate/bicarbonate transport system substrate-binding protein